MICGETWEFEKDKDFEFFKVKTERYEENCKGSGLECLKMRGKIDQAWKFCRKLFGW